MNQVEPETLSYRHCAERMGRSVRQVQRLVKAGRLKATGEGQKRRIALGSIEELLAEEREKYSVTLTDMSSTMSPVPGYGEVVQRLIKSLPPLNAPRSVSRRLGISLSEVEALLRTGDMPCIRLGSSVFVPRKFLVDLLARADGFGGLR
jgi:Helix-turn-helix domain